MLKSLKKSFHLTAALLCSISLFLAGAFIAPKQITAEADGPDASYTRITFRNFGLEDDTYKQADNASAKGTLGETLNSKYFSGNIKLSDVNASFYIGGTDVNKGFGIALSGVRLQAKFDGTNVKLFTKAKAGISDFVNTEFDLGITFLVTNTDTDGNNDDLKIGVYFNGVLYDNSYIEIADAAKNLGTNLNLACGSPSTSITVKSDANAKILPPSELQKITTDHFYIEDNTYGYNGGNVAAAGSYPLSLDGTFFNAKVKFSGAEGASIRYGGTENGAGLTGLMFSLSGDSLVLSDAIKGSASDITFTPQKAGLGSFSNTAFNLGLTVKYVDADEDSKNDDVELGVWINDTIYDNKYIYLVDYAPSLGSTLGIISTVDGAYVTVEAIEKLKVTMPDASLKKLTAYEHFGIADGEYECKGTVISTMGAYDCGLDNTYFSCYLKYIGKSKFYYAADPSGWNAIAFQYDGTNINVFKSADGAPIATLKPSVAGVKFNEQIRIGISAQFTDADKDGNKNDIKLGVYFNENLYDGTFFTVKDFLDTFARNTIAIYGDAGTKLQIGSIAEFKDPIASRPLDESFKKITFETVAIDDGIYKVNPDNAAAIGALGAYSKSFDGTCFGGTLKYSKQEGFGGQIVFGADATGWSGLTLKVNADGNFCVTDNRGTVAPFVFLPSRAGVQSFVDTEFNLGLSTRFTDCDKDGKNDDVELGVWFNDVLYNDTFVYLPDYVQYMGKNVSIYCPDANTIEVKSRADFIPVEIPEELNQDFTPITLSNFGVPDADYATEGLVANGKYLKTLNNTYFSFIANLSGNGIVPVINFAGAGDGWTGLGITVSENQITVRDNSGRTDTYFFTAKRAKVNSFLNKNVKLGVSTVYLDLDKDGYQDDVRFGIWVNDALANNEYIDLIDYRQYIGNEKEGIGAGLGIYISSRTNSNFSVKSIKIPVDIERFGFTLNWARELNIYANTVYTKSSDKQSHSPKTGEPIRPMAFAVMALGGILVIDTEKKHLN